MAPYRGKKCAYVAIAHSILIAIYHIFKEGVKYIDLGSEYHNQLSWETNGFFLERLI